MSKEGHKLLKTQEKKTFREGDKEALMRAMVKLSQAIRIANLRLTVTPTF